MSSDSGRYECQVTNKDDPDRILRGIYDLKVSPTKGQLEVLRVSDKLDYEEGDAISLFHSSRSFPSDEYRSSWKKVCCIFEHMCVLSKMEMKIVFSKTINVFV